MRGSSNRHRAATDYVPMRPNIARLRGCKVCNAQPYHRCGRWRLPGARYSKVDEPTWTLLARDHPGR